MASIGTVGWFRGRRVPQRVLFGVSLAEAAYPQASGQMIALSNCLRISRVALETRDGGCPDVTPHGSAPRPPPDSCRFVVLSSKGAIVCLVCAGRSLFSAAPSTPPAISRASSFGSTPSQTSISQPREGSGRNDGFARGGHASPGATNRSPMGGRRGLRLDGGANEQGGTRTSVDGGGHDAAQQVAVYLRRSCRFNSDLVRASIARWATVFSIVNISCSDCRCIRYATCPFVAAFRASMIPKYPSAAAVVRLFRACSTHPSAVIRWGYL